MAEKQVSAGGIIFSEGDVADFAYIVISGTIELFHMHNGAEVRTATLEPGKVFGELAVFEPQELREYTARAISDAVVFSIAQEEFQELFNQCPPPIQPFLLLAFEKFIPTKTRVKPQAASLPKGEIENITLSPESEALKAQFKPIQIPTSALPFRIGGYAEGGEKNRRDQLHLAIASQSSPLQVSRQHCEITFDGGDNLIVNDLGSRFGTVVNGVAIGRGRGIYTLPLQKGNNMLVLGGAESQYQLAITCGNGGAEKPEKVEKVKKASTDKYAGF